MIQLRELGKHRKLITPSVAPLFFWTALITTIMAGLFGLIDGLLLISDYPILGFAVIVITIAAVCSAILAIRLVTEFFLVSFRSNCHLSVIRKLLEGVEAAESYNDQSQVRLSRAA
jgi:hypothetical protein